MQLTCLGECLAPTIANGTTLEIESATPDAIRCGDLVVFSRRDDYTCLRVLYRKQEEEVWWFFLKADNTEKAEGWIPDYRIVGTVTGIGQHKRPTAASRRQDRRHLWRSRLGYSMAALRWSARALTETVRQWNPGHE